MLESELVIGGPLQAKVLLNLREEPFCGVELLTRLNLRSPGTIYPVLDSLKEKHLIDFEIVEIGLARKKVYYLTQYGMNKLHEYLMSVIKSFCNDILSDFDEILVDLEEIIREERNPSILCTIDIDILRSILKGTNRVFLEDLPVKQEFYDIILDFLGVGCLMEKEMDEIANHLRKLKKTLKKNGTLILVEVERTENIFAKAYFEQIFGLKYPPGLESNELRNILEEEGFKDARVKSINGLLYSVCRE